MLVREPDRNDEKERVRKGEAAKLIFIRHDSALKRTRRSLHHSDSLTAAKGTGGRGH